MSDLHLRALQRAYSASGAEEDRARLQVALCRTGKHDGGLLTGTEGCEGCWLAFQHAEIRRILGDHSIEVEVA